MTLSAADYHWPDLFLSIDPNVDINTLTDAKRKRRAEIFIEFVLKPIFGITDEWYRYEWQWRGSTHLHGLFWFLVSLDLDKLNFTEDEIEHICLYFDSLCH